MTLLKVTINNWPDYLDFRDKAPSNVRDYSNPIDRDIAEQTHCPECHKPMRYKGFGRYDGIRRDTIFGVTHTRYMAAFAVCDECQFAIMF